MTPGERKGIYRRAEVRSQGCDYQQKKSFPTKASARVHAARAGLRAGIKLYPYKCPGCGNFHVSKRAPLS